MVERKFEVARWDICYKFHGMSDIGFASGERKKQGYTYSRATTYNGECYASIDGDKSCHRRGICVRAIREKVMPRGQKQDRSRRGK